MPTLCCGIGTTQSKKHANAAAKKTRAMVKNIRRSFLMAASVYTIRADSPLTGTRKAGLPD